MHKGNELPYGPRPRERHQGSVTLRRDAVGSTTADQGLLDSRLRSEWKTKDAWRALRILSEFVEGFDTLADLPRAVSVFGSARSKPGSVECEMAERLGSALAQAGYAVITGGGPGVMEAANKGCSEAGGLSVGLGIELKSAPEGLRLVGVIRGGPAWEAGLVVGDKIVKVAGQPVKGLSLDDAANRLLATPEE